MRVRPGGSRDETMSKRWYIVHAYSNFERKVAEAIKDRAKAAGLSHLFEEVLVPTEEVMEVRPVKNKEEKADHYEITIKTADKKTLELIVSLDGKSVKTEDEAKKEEKKDKK